uniref:Uncharacterized protein n=1 Tax=Florenciella parvula TaxID=236787 RepID=A0A7S2B6Z5_9STRA
MDGNGSPVGHGVVEFRMDRHIADVSGSSNDPRHPASAALLPGTFWITTGGYPQVLSVHFHRQVKLNKIGLLASGVQEISAHGNGGGANPFNDAGSIKLRPQRPSEDDLGVGLDDAALDMKHFIAKIEGDHDLYNRPTSTLTITLEKGTGDLFSVVRKVRVWGYPSWIKPP